MTSLSLLTPLTSTRTRARTARPVRRTRGPRAVLLSIDLLSAAIVLGAVWLLGLSRAGTVALLFVPAWVVMAAMFGGHRGVGSGDWARPLTSSALVLPTGFVLLAEVTGPPASATLLVLMSLATAGVASLGRAATLTAVRRGADVPGLTHRVVVVGRSRAAQELLDAPAEHRGRFDVVGLCVPDRSPAMSVTVPVVVGLDRCVAGVVELGADAVVVADADTLDPADVRRLRWQLEGRGVQVFVATDVVDVASGRTRIDVAGGRMLLAVRESRHAGPARRAGDVAQRLLAVSILLLAAPVLLVLATLVRRDSPGPAFFRQTRIGRDGREFTMWKLRTMTRDAEAVRSSMSPENDGNGVLFKLHADPRVTRIGAWLRRLSLDELPQLINVCLGQMALIGPRPALRDEVERYPDDVRRRLVVKPGITGLWQVSGRSDLTWDESVRLDQYYVDNWSLRLDAAILLRTAGAVLRRRGAY